VLNPISISGKRLLFVGLGNRAEATRAKLHDAAAAAGRQIPTKKVDTIAFALPAPEFTLAAGVGLAQGCQGPGIRKTTPTRVAPEQFVLVGAATDDLPRVGAEGRGVCVARELVTLPPAELYPETFAATAADAGRATGFAVEVWDES